MNTHPEKRSDPAGIQVFNHKTFTDLSLSSTSEDLLNIAGANNILTSIWPAGQLEAISQDHNECWERFISII